MTNPSTAAHDDSAMPPADVVLISKELSLAYVQLQRAAEYQVFHHFNDTVQLVPDALNAIEKASKP